MSIEQDIARVSLQEQTLQFEHFDARTAWDIGSRLKAAAEWKNAAVAIDITVNGHPLFFYTMPGTSPDNADWIRRKRNTVQRWHRSSLGFGLKLEKDQIDLFKRFGVDFNDYAVHGGSFPLVVAGTGCIGSITVSGLPHREDHGIIVEVLANFLGKPLAGLALE